MIVDDVADMLSTGGLGTVGADICKGDNFGIADPSFAVLLTGGASSIHALRSTSGMAAVERPRIQIVVRSLSEETAMRKAQAAFRLFDGMPERTINGVRYLYATAVQPPFALERDENNRMHYTFSVDFQREHST